MLTDISDELYEEFCRHGANDGQKQLAILLPLLNDAADRDLLEFAIDNELLPFLDETLRPLLVASGREHAILRRAFKSGCVETIRAAVKFISNKERISTFTCNLNDFLFGDGIIDEGAVRFFAATFPRMDLATLLPYAMDGCDETVFDAILAAGVQLDPYDSDLFQMAILSRSEYMVDMFLDAGAVLDVNDRDTFLSACQGGCGSLITKLLTEGSHSMKDLKYVMKLAASDSRYNPAIRAIIEFVKGKEGYSDFLTDCMGDALKNYTYALKLFAAGADVEAVARNRQHLQKISDGNDVELADYLFENVKSPKTLKLMSRVLHPALSWMSSTAKFLVENKADVTQPRSLYYVCRNGDSVALKILMDAGARISHGNERALEWIKGGEYYRDEIDVTEMTNVLIKAGAQTRCPQGTWSVLHCMREFDSSFPRATYDAVMTMIEHDPGLLECRDTEGRTPLMSAMYYMRPRAVSFLLEAGADVFASDSTGKTPLMLMSCHPPYPIEYVDELEALMTKLVRALVDAGADPTRADHSQQTALHIATSAETFVFKEYQDEFVAVHLKVLCETVLSRPEDAQWLGVRWLNVAEEREERQYKRQRFF